MSEDLPAPASSAGGTRAGLAEARALSAAVISFKSPVSFLECLMSALCSDPAMPGMEQQFGEQ